MSGGFERLVERYLRTVVDDHPVAATYLGFHERDGELGDFSAEALLEKNRHLKDVLADLEKLAPGLRGDEAQVDAEALRASLRRSVFEYEVLRTHELNPIGYIGTALSGCNELIVGGFAPLPDRARSLVGRLRGIREVVGSLERNVARPPAVFASIGTDIARGGLAFVKSVLPSVAAQVPELAADLEEAGASAGEAFQRAERLLGELAESSREPFHVGRERYEWLLREYHMLEMDSGELRETGREALAETARRMAEVSAEVDAAREWREVVEKLKADHPPASGLRERYAAEMARARDFVRERGLVSIPDGEELEVIDTPVFLRKLLPYAAYHPAGPFEKRQRGLFYVTPVDRSASPEQQEKQLRGHSTHTIPIIALHEAYPGHHLQLVRANLQPRLARKLVHNTVFIEGWALYCEEMMKEVGFYADPLTRLGQLRETLWRAARVVVDVGLQLGEMSVAEAVEFMVSEVGLERVNATAEVRRYTANPTQPSSYLVGKLAIQDIRRRYEERAGAAFDLRTFHDELLDLGSIQPALAERALGLRAEG